MSAGRYTRGLTVMSRRVDPAELIEWLQTLPEEAEVSVSTGTHGDRHEFTAWLPGPEQASSIIDHRALHEALVVEKPELGPALTDRVVGLAIGRVIAGKLA